MPANRAEFHPQSASLLDRAALPALAVQYWEFSPSRAKIWPRLRRLRQRLRRESFPAHNVLKPPVEAGDWTLFFLFLPDGALHDAQRDTLARLRGLSRRLMIVAAAPAPDMLPPMLADTADALVWKDLPGFDFSAYALGLNVLADTVPGSDVFVMNDSVIGPLCDLEPWLSAAPWDLTGFTASSNVENHIQSYAWLLRDVSPRRIALLGSVLSTKWAYNRFWSVVLDQETRLARVASRSMSVGAFLFADTDDIEDLTWVTALPLLRAGFPFFKRSLLGGKLAHLYDEEELRAALGEVGYAV